MKNSMLEHQKKVFENISWKGEVFQKELVKSKEWLSEEEFRSLQLWLKSRFDNYGYNEKHSDTEIWG